MELEMMKLYGAPPTRALRVIWLLKELGLDYEMLPVNILQGENQRGIAPSEYLRCKRAGFMA